MTSQKKVRIMVIDDNVTNLNIARMALGDLYDVALIPSGEKALTLFERVTPDLILLDVEMPGMNGFDVIKHIKAPNSPVKDVPVIFVTAKDDSSSEYAGLDLGAVDYVTKPFSFPLLLKRVELHLALVKQQRELFNYSQNLELMVEEKTKVISELQYAIVHVLADMVEKRDTSTGGHLARTQTYLKMLLEAARDERVYHEDMEEIDVNMYVQASQLHDVGKVSIADSILLKPGKLTMDEFDRMKEHTVIGENAIKYAMGSVSEKRFLEVAAAFAGSHHERWDGTGYPRGLSGLDIPLEGRLMAIVDVYDALISERPYKKSLPHHHAVDIIKSEKGTHFDPYLVDVFTRISDVFERISQAVAD